MGRKRIKKKDSVLPFRETVAYRFILVVGSILLFVVASFQTIGALMQSNTPTLIVAALVSAGAAFLAIHNVGQMQRAKVPKQTLQRMRRR